MKECATWFHKLHYDNDTYQHLKKCIYHFVCKLKPGEEEVNLLLKRIHLYNRTFFAVLFVSVSLSLWSFKCWNEWKIFLSQN